MARYYSLTVDVRGKVLYVVDYDYSTIVAIPKRRSFVALLDSAFVSNIENHA